MTEQKENIPEEPSINYDTILQDINAIELENKRAALTYKETIRSNCFLEILLKNVSKQDGYEEYIKELEKDQGESEKKQNEYDKEMMEIDDQINTTERNFKKISKDIHELKNEYEKLLTEFKEEEEKYYNDVNELKEYNEKYEVERKIEELMEIENKNKEELKILEKENQQLKNKKISMDENLIELEQKKSKLNIKIEEMQSVSEDMPADLKLIRKINLYNNKIMTIYNDLLGIKNVDVAPGSVETEIFVTIEFKNKTILELIILDNKLDSVDIKNMSNKENKELKLLIDIVKKIDNPMSLIYHFIHANIN